MILKAFWSGSETVECHISKMGGRSSTEEEREKRRVGLPSEGVRRENGGRKKKLDTFLPSCRTELGMPKGRPGVHRGYY